MQARLNPVVTNAVVAAARSAGRRRGCHLARSGARVHAPTQNSRPGLWKGGRCGARPAAPMAHRAGAGARGTGPHRLSRQYARAAASARAGARRAGSSRDELGLRYAETNLAIRSRASIAAARSGERPVRADREEPRVHARAVAAGAGAQPRQAGGWHLAWRDDFMDARPPAQRAIDLIYAGFSWPIFWPIFWLRSP